MKPYTCFACGIKTCNLYFIKIGFLIMVVKVHCSFCQLILNCNIFVLFAILHTGLCH